MSSTYEMTIDLNVLDHLGINLYSNIAAVLTEAVANAWDADASTVNIFIDEENDEITITDDGIGMSIEDMNTKYLRVGYKRRKAQEPNATITAKGRPVMGRKGLGKLSLFSIADVIEIQSCRDSESHGLKMSTYDIQKSIQDNNSHYFPEPLPSSSITLKQGTKITLHSIKRHRLGIGIKALRTRLARRFSVIGEKYGFNILINNELVAISDRGDLPVVQFLWHFGNNTPDCSAARKLIEMKSLPERLSSWSETEWKISGWIGTSTLPKDLDSQEAGNLNSIVILARGRLFHENILDKLNDGRHYTKYLTGQIEADFLDSDDENDIATSDRQRVQEDDPRYIELIAFLKTQLSIIEKEWNELRKKHESKRLKTEIPALANWVNTLPPGFKKSADSMLATLSSLPLNNEEDRKLIFRHGIMAFERMKLRGSTEDFSNSINDINKLLSLLADRDSLEAALYRDIVKSRLDAIQEFQGIHDTAAKERVLQKYLFNHLWLLDASWERATNSEIMERRLVENGILIKDLTEKEKKGRIDIAYRTNAGKHLIIELKRSNRKMKLLELIEQGNLYVDTLKKILNSMSESHPNIEVVFVLGTPIEEENSNPNRIKSAMESISPGSRITYYDTLIHGAQMSYKEYIQASKELDTMESILDQME